MFCIVLTQNDQPGAVFGPFNNHAEANQAMQLLYDDKAEQDSFEEGDDSDASHLLRNRRWRSDRLPHFSN